MPGRLRGTRARGGLLLGHGGHPHRAGGDRPQATARGPFIDQKPHPALETIGHYLGVAIGSLVNIFGLERMAIGGGFGICISEQLLPAACGAVLREVGDGGRALQIERAVLGEAAGMIGAGLIALEAL